MENFNILVICGPTACGKTSLAVSLALKFNGEIISGDSRQVFRGMDIGTGKDLPEYSTPTGNVPYHLIDIADPIEDYNLYRYISDFNKSFDDITGRGKLPVLAGGSGLYMESVIKGYDLFPAPEDVKLRDSLNGKSKEELTAILKTESEYVLNKTDTTSSRRIIRGIEIAKYLNQNPVLIKENSSGKLSPLIIGIAPERSGLLNSIDARLLTRLENGMIDEVKFLIKKGVTFEKLIKLGLEYRYCAMYIKNEISYNDMIDKLKIEIHKFSKRQMTWFRGMERRGLKIHWIKMSCLAEAERIIENAVHGTKSDIY